MTKRGRKRINEEYFGPNEELAVIDFLQCEDEKTRNFIFDTHLKKPLDKMCDSIIRRYKLQRDGFTFEETHGDTMSFLMTKSYKFDITLGKKAYSYFGTIIKRYLIQCREKDAKANKRLLSYDDMYETIQNRNDQTYDMETETFNIDIFLDKLLVGIKDELNDEDKPIKKKLTDNEKKVGYALIEILENWEPLFEAMDGGNKYNKNSVLEMMRNYTSLSTKDIRVALKRFKTFYEFMKHKDD